MGIKSNTKDRIAEGKKLALLIGVDTFSDPGIPSLRGVTKDINKLGKLLKNRQRSEFNVESLLNPSFVQSRKAISKISQQAQANDVVFFYYSGHGVFDQQQSLYLLFGDSETSFLDATCLESEFILSQFRKSACQNFILIIDCCHSGAFFNNNRGLPKGLFALTACDEQGLSYEDEKGGIFTNIIINGLTSDYIDADRDGKITFSELFDYVIDEIKSNPSWRSGAPQKWEWNVNKDICFFDSPRPVFISYKRVQTKLVKKLSQKLNEAEIPTFVDLEKIRIGDNWKRELEDTIKNARVFLFVLDNEILYSEVSNWELEKAYHNNIPILPIMVEEVKVPAIFESKYGHINRMGFSKEYFDDDVKTLIEHIKSLRIKKEKAGNVSVDVMR